jgi:iron complex outermembrane recepter protein
MKSAVKRAMRLDRTRIALAVMVCLTASPAAFAQDAATASGQEPPTASPADAAAQAPADAPGDAAATEQSDTDDDVQNMSEVVVTGQLAALRRAQAIKQDAAGVVDAISAEEAGKFPDQNIADSLQRVPGVSVNRTSGGESSQVTVRGLGPQFVNVLLNGRSIVSDADNRGFNFDTLPSELISTAEVYKTSAADIVDGGIGGTINIRTARPLDNSGFHFAGTLAAVNDSMEGGLDSKSTPKASFFVSNSNADRTFGWLLSGMYYERFHRTYQISQQGWYVFKLPGELGSLPPAFDQLTTEEVATPETTIGNYDERDAVRKGLNAAIDWAPADNFKLKFDAMYTNYQVDILQRGLGYYGNTNDITDISVYDNGTASEFTRSGESGVLATDFIVAPGVRDAKVLQTGLNLNWQINDSTTLELDLARSRSWNKYDNGAGYLVVGTRNFGYTPHWTNPDDGGFPYYNYDGLAPADDMSNLWSHCCNIGGNHLTNRLNEYKLNLSKSFMDGVLAKLDFGVLSSSRSNRNISMGQDDAMNLCTFYCGYNSTAPADEIGAHLFDAGGWFGGYSQGFPSQWVSFDPNAYLEWLTTPESYLQMVGQKSPEDIAAFVAALEANGGGWATHPIQRTYNQVKEKNRSFYVKASLEGTMREMPWYLDLGYRYIKTDTEAAAFVAPLLDVSVNPTDTSNAVGTFGAPAPVQEDGSYAYWLPSANFKLNLRDDLIFRLNASRTLTRPELTQLRVSASYNFRPNNQTVTIGNTDLKPYLSENFDTALEWYYADTSYIALGAFHKKVTNFSTLVDTEVEILGFLFTQTQPVNLEEGTIKGLEFTFNHQFTGLPAPWDGLGMAFNYTHVKSDVSIDESILAGGGRFAIPGIGDSANLSAFYEKGPWQARLAYNWRDEWLSCISCGAGSQPETIKPYGQLDMSAAYSINDHFSVFVEGTNLTRETREGYMVYEDRPTFLNFEGRTYTFGVRAKW